MSDILITGGAGYIGSLLTAACLRAGHTVTVLDTLLFGGESLLPFFSHPRFRFVKADVTEPRALRDAIRSGERIPETVVHLAAIVGFPACQAIGRQAAWRYNVEATKQVYEEASSLGVARFVFASSYSNYGFSNGTPVTEDSPLNPQSLYAETKIAAEEFLLSQKGEGAAPLIFRFATLYGVSPRMRFDLIVNQFVLEAYLKRSLIIYQRGYSRSFVHIQDVVKGILLGIGAPKEKIRGKVYNLGSAAGNLSKNDVVALILKRLPETVVRYKDLTFGGDMRDITVSFEKIQRELGFSASRSVDDGIREVLYALKKGIFHNPMDTRYRNAQFIVQ
jgi:nucleoside-diphosphate-sugar epimerase